MRRNKPWQTSLLVFIVSIITWNWEKRNIEIVDRMIYYVINNDWNVSFERHGRMNERKRGKIMHIVLHQPEIPANTGNIGRTCVATGTTLHLIEPLGFRLNEKEIKRAGMDYWEHLDVRRYVNFSEFLEKKQKAKIWMATTKAKLTYTDVNYGPDDFIMFGKESAGIPEEILVDHADTCIRIPMLSKIRSLNLSNSVAIVLYEALRQQNFNGMQLEGELHRLHW